MNPDVNVCAVSTLKNAKLMARLKKVFPFTVESVPSVVSFDYGSYYSNYDYGMDDDKYYGSLEDLVKYVEGIGKAPVVTKTK